MNKKNTNKPIFFVDRALGKNLVKILRNAGANAEAHIDHFAPNSPDIEWLPEVSRRRSGQPHTFLNNLLKTPRLLPSNNFN